jgi:hypothetical protein
MNEKPGKGASNGFRCFELEQDNIPVFPGGNEETYFFAGLAGFPAEGCRATRHPLSGCIGLVNRCPDSTVRAERGFSATLREVCIDAFQYFPADDSLYLNNRFFHRGKGEGICCKDIDIIIHEKDRGIEQVEEFPDIEPAAGKDPVVTGWTHTVADRSVWGSPGPDNRITERADGFHGKTGFMKMGIIGL